MPFAVLCASGEPNELTFTYTIKAECAIKLAVNVADGDAHASVNAFHRAVGDIQAAVVADHSVGRVVEAAPFHRG